MACGAFCTKRDSRKENQADAGLMSVPILSGTLYRQLAEQCAGKSAIRSVPWQRHHGVAVRVLHAPASSTVFQHAHHRPAVANGKPRRTGSQPVPSVAGPAPRLPSGLPGRKGRRKIPPQPRAMRGPVQAPCLPTLFAASLDAGRPAGRRRACRCKQACNRQAIRKRKGWRK